MEEFKNERLGVLRILKRKERWRMHSKECDWGKNIVS